MSSPELLLTYMKINPLDQNTAEQQCGISDKILVLYCEGKLKNRARKTKYKRAFRNFPKGVSEQH
ncbi:hypothetical protein HpBGD82_13670 [Helicobacter pylori]